MNKLNLILIGLVIFSTSCVQKRDGETQNTLASKVVGVTDNEYKGVGEVIAFYGGKCNRHIGFETKNGEKLTYFELEMMESESLEEYAQVIDMPASNIAYLFYRNLNTDEKAKYSFIRVTVDFKSGEQYQSDYYLDNLERLTKNLDRISSVTELMIQEDYSNLLLQFDIEIAKDLTIEQLQALCKQVDSQFGKIDSIQFQGFSFFNVTEPIEKELLHLAGIHIRQGQNTPFSIFVDPEKVEDEKFLNTLKFEF